MAGGEFGRELRRRRLDSGLSLGELAILVHYSRGHLSRVETGHTVPTTSLVRACDTALNANGELLALDPRASNEVVDDSEAVSKALALRIPSIADDDTVGPDRLGIAADARALAALMASRQLVPPLAVAVYGEWGSGKTFFMRQIEANIDRLVVGDSAGTNFEPAVRHIRFSAWHYAQGNLWASLLKHIFTSLCPPDSTSEQMFAAATAKIAAIQEVVDSADIRVDASQQRVNDVDDEIKHARARHAAKIDSLKSVRLQDIWSGVVADQDVRNEFERAREELGIPAATDSAHELLTAAREVISLGSRTRILATAGKHWYSSPLAGAYLIGALGLILTVILAKWAPQVTSGIGPFVATFATVGSSAAAWIGRQSQLARRLLEPAERLQAQIEQRLGEERAKQAAEAEKLTAEAKEAQAELTTALAQRANALDELDAAHRALSELTPAQLLQRYLADRVASGEYDKHLGVVGVVHRDLLNLSAHLRATASDPAVTTKRIVLYIDDLDRCSPVTVVQVLEAIHLLLALPLFVVVLGVDRRIVNQSVATVHSDLLATDSRSATPSEYLEKIFQLTFTLPAMNASGCQAILREVASRSRTSISTAADNVGATEGDGEQTSVPKSSSSDRELAESLILHDADLATLDVVAPLVAVTPRRAKRFLNVFIVVRARLAAESQDIAALAVLVAALVGAPRTLGHALRQLDAADTADLTFGVWARDVLSATAEETETSRIADFLDSDATLLDLPLPAVLAHMPLVAPYT
ncbi:P-loop NTPase fold protein [Nocardia nepalensis]|uniref:P-loop NTPase fold protein n=1 Tax=Nocardia nepalensis TaxID=3375448 RepID=UPI003B67405F